MSDSKDAANRIRAMRAASDDHDGGYPDTTEGRSQAMLDHVCLAEAYLSEHLPDDDEPVRNDLATHLTPEEVERVKQLTGDVRDCLDGNLPHDSMTYRGTLLHQLMEVILPMLSKLEQMK